MCDNGFNWQRFSIIRIQNHATTPVMWTSTTTIATAPWPPGANKSIPAGQALTRHNRRLQHPGFLGDNWEGSVYKLNQPLVAVSEWYQNAFSNPASAMPRVTTPGNMI